MCHLSLGEEARLYIYLKSDMLDKLEEAETKIINAVTEMSSSDSETETPPPSSDIEKPTANKTTNDIVTLEVLKILKEIQKDFREDRKRRRRNYNSEDITEDNNQRKKQNKKGGTKNCRTDISKYCWSCGAWNHPGKYCRRKKPGHKSEATFDNKMGGSTLYCMEINKE